MKPEGLRKNKIYIDPRDGTLLEYLFSDDCEYVFCESRTHAEYSYTVEGLAFIKPLNKLNALECALLGIEYET